MSEPNPTAAADGAAITLVAATELEAAPLRREVPQARVVTGGIGLAGLREPLGAVVVSCGLAGGLREDLPTGALLLPREVLRPDGRVLRCDDALVDAFASAARRLGMEPVFAPLLTSATIVNGAARSQWAAAGYAGVDMETGRIEAPRVAAVRMVLDTPAHELSTDWERPMLAMLKPWNWPQAVWLAREAPRAARAVARVVAQGIATELRITRQW